MSEFNIAIIGAGPAGSTLGRLLHLANIPCTIFEGEASANFRGQGGTLDLHANSGQAALKECSLYDEFLKYCRYDGEAMVIADKHYRKYLNESGKTTQSTWGRPEIDRRRLRDILLESLPAEMIRWGKKLKTVEDLDGELTLVFADGTRETGFDLIVGADGAFSHVRPLLSETKPYYSGIGGVWGLVPNAENKHPELHKQVNRGSLFSFSDGKSIMAQQLGDGSLNVSAAWVRPADWKSEEKLKSSELKKAALEEFEDWDTRLIALVEAIDEETVVSRNLYMLPVGHRWKHRQGVTLIGDASHVFTPYAGEGVNLAMADSMNLAHAIVSANKKSISLGQQHRQQTLSDEIQFFEHDMFNRAMAASQMTKEMMESMFFTPGAPYTSIERYVYTAISDNLPWGTHGIVKGCVSLVYWIYKTFFLAPTPN
jgi:2-polyprenyl-6-methoxyphenol hydroxylase-like FAD-dependent oxidoreductase